MQKMLKYQESFSKFVPPAFAHIPAQLLSASPVQFKIVKGRKTKLGDFRPRNIKGKPQITVNGDLNPYAFLITTLHEFAHWDTFQQFGLNVSPHGIEWKVNFKRLISLIIDHPELPLSIRKALQKNTHSIKASSCTDIHLSRVLSLFDSANTDLVSLEKLAKNSTFVLNNKTFIKGEKRRTRVECVEIISRRRFLVHIMAKVKHIHNE